MSVDQIGSIFFVVLAAIAIIGGLLLNMNEQGFFLRIDSLIKRHFKLYYMIPLAAISAIILIYAINVGFDKEEPNAAHFGQMGDYFGGILNPIFGLITIIIVLHTARMQKTSLDEQLESAKHLKKLRNIESLRELIDAAKKSCEEEKERKFIRVENEMYSYSEIIGAAHQQGKLKTAENELIDTIDQINNPRETDKHNTKLYFAAVGIVESHLQLLDLMMALFREDEFNYTKINIAKKVFRFLLDNDLILPRHKHTDIRKEIDPYLKPNVYKDWPK